MLRNNFDTRHVLDIPFRQAIRNLNRHLRHPREIIEGYNAIEGRNFWTDEVFPLNASSTRAAWYPNYALHIIGEGMLVRKLEEWYDYQGAPYPKLFSILTTASYQYMNEVVEIGPYEGNSPDHIADFYIFNPIGWFLFSSDTVANFWSDLRLSYWPPQPMFNPYNGILGNAGEQYIIKFKMPKSDRFDLFVGWGIDTTGGLSYKADDGRNYSAGFGLQANRLVESIRLQQRWVYPDLKPHFVFHIDQDDSLLLSITQTGVDDLDLHLNIYPGFFPGKNWGLYFATDDAPGTHFGISYRLLPIGIFFGK